MIIGESHEVYQNEYHAEPTKHIYNKGRAGGSVPAASNYNHDYGTEESSWGYQENQDWKHQHHASSKMLSNAHRDRDFNNDKYDSRADGVKHHTNGNKVDLLRHSSNMKKGNLNQSTHGSEDGTAWPARRERSNADIMREYLSKHPNATREELIAVVKRSERHDYTKTATTKKEFDFIKEKLSTLKNGISASSIQHPRRGSSSASRYDLSLLIYLYTC